MARLAVRVVAFLTLMGYITCAATGETDCQRRRREEQESTEHRANLLIPECDENGDYKALQCFGRAVRGKPFCACYDKDFGQIKGPSKNIESCNCVRAHHEWEHSTDSNKGSEPRCNATSGAYNQVQCDTNEHWCVDWDSGEQQGLKMNGGCSTDLSGMTCGIVGTHHAHSGSHHGESAHHHGASDAHSGSGSDGTSHHGAHDHHGDTSHHGDAGHN
uniref:Putative thyropin n=1 Tax=Amblyomma parvum TaxID=251391 RepID=A0A023G1K6_AMBPA